MSECVPVCQYLCVSVYLEIKIMVTPWAQFRAESSPTPTQFCLTYLT